MAPIETNWRPFKKSPPEAYVRSALAKNTEQVQEYSGQVQEFFWQVQVSSVQSQVFSERVQEFFWQVRVFFVQSRVSSVQEQEFFWQVQVFSEQEQEHSVKLLVFSVQWLEFLKISKTSHGRDFQSLPSELF